MTDKKKCVVAFDTSNYTTSIALCDIDGRVVANLKAPLPVKSGERGLRQSDAVFAHTKNLPELCKRLAKEGKRSTVILGFGSADEVFYKERFEALDARVIVCTVDGSEGVRGFVTDGMKGVDYTYFYTCGPEPMLKAVYNASATSGQFSFEERMGCGFGACMGCSCKTVTGYKRICKDGPVLEKEEILWEK